MKKKAYMTYGVPASGKSSWVQAQEDYDGHNRINMDDIRDEFKNSGMRPRQLWNVAAFRLLKMCDEQKEVIYIDNTHCQRWQWDLFAEILLKNDYEITLVYFDVPLATLLQQNASRVRPDRIVPRDVVGEYFDKMIPLKSLDYPHHDFIVRRPSMGNLNDCLPKVEQSTMETTDDSLIQEVAGEASPS